MYKEKISVLGGKLCFNPFLKSSNARQHFSLFIFSWSIFIAAGLKIFLKSFNILNGQGFIQDQKSIQKCIFQHLPISHPQ